MSRLRPAMSAPRRPTKATSAPSTASQAAMFAPEPPPCIVTVAGVSLPLASGAVACATVSVMRSPTTTTRVNVVTTLINRLCQDEGGATLALIKARALELNSFADPSRADQGRKLRIRAGTSAGKCRHPTGGDLQI